MAEEITTQILIQIREEIRGLRGEMRDEIRATNDRLEKLEKKTEQFRIDVNRSFDIVAMLLRGMDTRLGRLEDSNTFIPRRVDVLEQKVARIEGMLDLDQD